VPGLYGSPTLAPSGDGRLELFVFDDTGSLWHIYQTAWSNGWSDWELFGAAEVWPAAAHPSGDGRLEVFTASPDNGLGSVGHIYQTAWSNGWSDWGFFDAPPPVAGGFWAPGVAAGADGRLAAFTANGELWRLQQTAWSNGWSDWNSHGSPPGSSVTGPVSAVRSGDGRIEVFVIDADGGLWNIRQTSANGSYSGWNEFGTSGVPLTDRPGLARSADGRLELFIVGGDGTLYHQWETAVGTFTWSGWAWQGNPAAGGLVDHPVLAASADGRLELFVTGADGNVWHTWQTQASDGWSAWDATNPPAGTRGSAPEVHASGDGRLELFVVGGDGSLWHSWQTQASDGWSDWISHGQP